MLGYGAEMPVYNLQSARELLPQSVLPEAAGPPPQASACPHQ